MSAENVVEMVDRELVSYAMQSVELNRADGGEYWVRRLLCAALDAAGLDEERARKEVLSIQEGAYRPEWVRNLILAAYSGDGPPAKRAVRPHTPGTATQIGECPFHGPYPTISGCRECWSEKEWPMTPTDSEEDHDGREQ